MDGGTQELLIEVKLFIIIIFGEGAGATPAACGYTPGWVTRSDPCERLRMIPNPQILTQEVKILLNIFLTPDPCPWIHPPPQRLSGGLGVWYGPFDGVVRHYGLLISQWSCPSCSYSR